jgi:probable addiction module antidote protein
MNRKVKAPAHRGHDEATLESLGKDSAFAAEYLSAVLADGDVEELLLALRRAAQAFGGVTKLAAEANLNPTSLYRALSARGNPEVRSLAALLKAMGMRLAIQPIAPASRRGARRKTVLARPVAAS